MWVLFISLWVWLTFKINKTKPFKANKFFILFSQCPSVSKTGLNILSGFRLEGQWGLDHDNTQPNSVSICLSLCIPHIFLPIDWEKSEWEKVGKTYIIKLSAETRATCSWGEFIGKRPLVILWGFYDDLKVENGASWLEIEYNHITILLAFPLPCLPHHNGLYLRPGAKMDPSFLRLLSSYAVKTFPMCNSMPGICKCSAWHW